MAAVERLRRIACTGLRSVARDVTAASASRSALIIAPHPDDETLGCGATILRKTAAGTPVNVLVVTDGRHSHRSDHVTPEQLAQVRRGEMAEAARRLGLAPTALRWAGFVDGTLAEHEDELVGYLAACLDELRPSEVYATCAEESHPDHAVVGRVARRAVATAGADLLEYPVWLWGTWPLRRGDRVRSTVDVVGRLVRRRAVSVRAEGNLAGKMYALQAHASQLRRPDGVPADAEWPALPPALLATAAEPSELFFPWRR